MERLQRRFTAQIVQTHLVQMHLVKRATTPIVV
jgi:hypothetical protein